ncbi:MAG TPA: hypothetical protein DC049_19220 [Spirochaetia bacterium]|nr:hypothetical protein [Spirochaetia bacterium]
MAKQASSVKKAEYNERITPLKAKINSYLEKIKKTEIEIKTKTFDDRREQFKKLLELIRDLTALGYIEINVSIMSLETINIKNENYLNDVRKHVSEVLQYIEMIGGKIIDTPLNENEEIFQDLNQIIDDSSRLRLIQSIGLLIDRLEWMYGDNSKWKWSFVDIEGRFVTAAKNIVDFTSIIKNLDPSIPGYADRMDLYNLLRLLINEASDRFRDKYEMTGKGIDDMKSALNFLSLLKRIHLVMGEEDEAAECKKKYDIWKKKLEEDTKEKENKNGQ